MLKLFILLGATGLVLTVAVEKAAIKTTKKFVTGCSYDATCVATPEGAGATWKWYNDAGGNTAIGGEDTAKYKITAAGTFVCGAKGDTGEEKKSADLVVKFIANTDVIPTVEVPAKIEAGKKVTLTCKSEAACTGMTFEWYKDASATVVAGQTAADLVIEPPAAGVVVKYKCKSKIGGTASGESAQVDVKLSSFGAKATYSMMVLVLATFAGFLMKM